MTHQPYLDWLSADTTRPDEVLTYVEQVDLQKHLDECPECRRISNALSAVEEELKTAPLLVPEAGFATRWQARLAMDRQRLHRRQAIRLSAASLGAALVLFALLVFLAWPLLSSPGLLAWTYLYQIIRFVSLFSTVEQFTGGLVRAAGSAILPFVWVMMTGVLALLVGAWAAAYYALTSRKNI
jgi:predicted anti-sigma-YlaC factor YlaD